MSRNAKDRIVPIWSVILLIIILAIIVLLPSTTLSGINATASDAMKNGVNDNNGNSSTDGNIALNPDGLPIAPAPVFPEITHVSVPKAVKAVYISSWVAGTANLRNKIIDLVDKSEANAVVIDIKDYTGLISFMPSTSPSLMAEGCIEERIKGAPELMKSLHEKNIYIIGRIAVFQDPCMVKKHPEWAVKTKSTGAVWKDHKGITWMDAGSPDVWNYNVEIAKAAHAIGFDELNFDYIRYPSDGNMEDISFPVSGTSERSEVLKNFFAYIDKELRGGRAVGVTKAVATVTMNASGSPVTTPPIGRYTTASDPAFDDLVSDAGLQIPSAEAAMANTALDGKLITTTIDKAPRPIISADLFGFVTTNNDDLGIGQILEKVAPFVDFIGPMVYPSHYPKNFIGLANPSAHPYDVVKYAMAGGVKKLKAIGLNPLKLRPWLQDFNLGATYTADMVRAQIKATYDVGLTSWMLWDASNTYTPGGVLSI